MDTSDMKTALQTREGREELRSLLWGTGVCPVSARMALIEATKMLDEISVDDGRGTCKLDGCDEPITGRFAKKYCCTRHRIRSAQRAYSRRKAMDKREAAR